MLNISANPSGNLFPQNYSDSALSFNHLLPSKSEAQDIFWGLRDNFWKPIIDGEFHDHGPMVFDRALHGGRSEPGFFDSLKKGCEFASDHLTEKLTIEFYKDLHKVLCTHFEGSKNHTLMVAAAAGRFRENADVSSSFPLRELDKEHQEKYFIKELMKKYRLEEGDSFEECSRYIQKFLRTYSGTHSARVRNIDFLKEEQVGKIMAEKYPDAKAWVKKDIIAWKEKVEVLNDYFSKLAEQFSVNKFVSITENEDILNASYLCTSSKQHETIIQQLFDTYNQKMFEINFKLKGNNSTEELSHLVQEKIEAIAHVFQVLDWLHPFQDGQGRTDLVLLAKLLSEEGLNPAILENPYFSSTATLSEWKEYLSHGIELWRLEKQKVS